MIVNQICCQLPRVKHFVGLTLRFRHYDRHRAMAATDCGFETTAGLATVAEEIVWEKLRAMREGAEIATRRMLG